MATPTNPLEVRVADMPPRPTAVRSRSTGFWSRLRGRDRQDAPLASLSAPDDSRPIPRPPHVSSGPGLAAYTEGLVHSVARIGLGAPGLHTLLRVKEAAAFHQLVNDRSYLMEDLIKTAVKDANGEIGKSTTKAFVSTLWNDLPHPPSTYLAGDARYRTADGSGNSILHPTLGASGQPYARTVEPSSAQPIVQPDPGVLFDCLLQRRKPTEHPAQISSVLFYLATIIIHDLFRTDHANFAYSKTSSYLDLAPLYGSDEAEQMRMRTKQDGKLFPDCFSETRLLVLPPGSGILLIMFNRFHNHAAEQLVAINEGGRFTKPNTSDELAYQRYDENVFQTARLITCGLYVNIILLDYVRTILNLNRTESDWHLDPRVDIPGGPEMGVGNQVSAEFNLVYRWHATVSPKDEAWTQAEFEKLFPGQKPADVPMPQFLGKLGRLEAQLEAQAPFDRQFAEFKRGADGTYNDEQLVEAICSRIDDCANAYGPRQIPAILKAVEVLGIKQARSWNLATLNEFRKHFSLAPHTSFDDITHDKEVATHLKNLYKDVDNVELYPGLLVEDAKEPMVPGSGLCPSFTVSRAVLSDAVSLVRGDRFYTTSYTPRLLTNWGYEEANYDTKVDLGCVMYKLFQRAFPRHFNPDSIYIHYPLTVAKTVKEKILAHEIPGRANFYEKSLYQAGAADFKGHAAPSFISLSAEYLSIKDNMSEYTIDMSLASAMLYPKSRDNASFSSAIGKFLCGSKCFDATSMQGDMLATLRSEFEKDLRQSLEQASYPLTTYREVDIVADVINPSSARLAISLFHIPHSGHGKCTEPEVRDILSIMAATWSNYDRVYLTRLRQRAVPTATKLRESMLTHSSNAGLPAALKPAMAAAGLTKDQAAIATLALAASFATTLAQALAESVAHLLGPATASQMAGPLTDADAAAIARGASQAITLLTRGEDTVLLSGAVLGASAPLSFLFPADERGWQALIQTAVGTGLRTIMGQRGLRAARVSTGPDTLRRVPVQEGVQVAYLSEKWDALEAWPASMKVNWDL